MLYGCVLDISNATSYETRIICAERRNVFFPHSLGLTARGIRIKRSGIYNDLLSSCRRLELNHRHAK